MKRVLSITIALVLVVVAGLYLNRGALTLRAMRGVVEANMGPSWVSELPDGLYVALCGAGSPLPDPGRSGPCVAVVAGEQLYVVDSGSGSSRVMSQLRIPQGEVDGVLLTHFHSDHIDGLGELLLQRWAGGGQEEPVPVYGGEGVEEVVEGFNIAYRQDHTYRVAHHGAATMPPGGAGALARPFAVPPDGESRVVLERDGLKITTFRVDHPPIEPAVGYRFDYKGRSILLSGDTNQSANLERFAKGVDLLVHEALAPQLVGVITEGAEAAGNTRVAKITRDILDYHASPVEAAESAQAVGAAHLLFYHIVPPLPLAPMQELFLEGVDDVYDGPVTLGRDGTFIRLEVGSEAVVVEELL